MTADPDGKKPRLLVLASTYPRWVDDHEPSFVHALAQRLTDRFEVIAIVPHAPKAVRREVLDGVLVSRYRYAPAALETLVNDGGIAANLRRSPWKWLLLPSFVVMQWLEARRWLRKGALVHAHWLIPQGLVARMLGAPSLLTCHGADVFSLRGKAASMAKKFALSKATDVTIVSAAMVGPLIPLAHGLKPKIRPMGVDLQTKFTPGSEPREVASLLFVGRLVEKKGLDVLIRAMPSVVAQHPHVQLSIVGHGPLDGRMRDEVARLGLEAHVHFIGPLAQDDLVPLYRAATVFVGPFRQTASGDQEGLGLVLVEALGCACPVVASDIPATRDVLLETPGCIMVPPANEELLARALIEVLDDPRTIQADAAHAVQLMRKRFDWTSVARGYGDLLQALLEGESR
ncbi:glycosyltransferase family 4 protein [Luteibacter sp.]|uniref:glycosyltransferase family 4 protein n=1 Tax=Luteibacter sp. TaxID=1886636 RepID=UPI003F8157BE